MDAKEILAQTPLFANALDEVQIGYLASQSRPAFFRANTRLMSQGDFGGSMFIIVRGEVLVSLSGGGKDERMLATLGPGEIVGEMSLFTGDRRTATVAAKDNVEALEITKASLERIFLKSPELIGRFGKVVAKRQAQLRLAAAPTESARDAFIKQARAAFSGLFRAAR